LIASVADKIAMARRLIAGEIYQTPLERSNWLSEACGAETFLKLECYQPTGSFKVRGASAAVRSLDSAQKRAGVITASAGNHGLGLAYAASRAGIGATVVVPEYASSAKLQALKRFPIEVRVGGPTYDDAERTALEVASASGAYYISPYNHPHVIAGQGTIGLEMLEAPEPPDVVLIPVGGGGLISGVGSAIKHHRPSTRIVAVQAANSPAMAEALRAGELVSIAFIHSLADGLQANIEPGSITFDIAREVIDDVVLISEEEMVQAIRLTFAELHVAIEASAAVGIAALLSGKVSEIAGKRVAVVLTGRNIAPDTLASMLTGD
jgi:threonine dehydratase